MESFNDLLQLLNICCLNLHKASKRGHIDCIQHLLEQGADVNAIVHDTNALHIASMKGHLDCLRALLDAGARTDLKTVMEILHYIRLQKLVTLNV